MAETSLGKKIKERRLQLQITQKELAGDMITRNMLSQIENDLAMPSIKTLEHIASTLDKPVSYFLGDIKNDEKKAVNNLLGDLISLYDEGQYKQCIRITEQCFEDNPRSINSDILKSIYINCCLKNAEKQKDNKLIKEAKASYAEVLEFINEYSDNEDISLYNIYSKLSDLSSELDEIEDSIEYNDKANYIVSKIKNERILQRIYTRYLANEYEEVVNALRTINVDELSVPNKGKYFFMMGSSLFYKAKYGLAIGFLEKAADYYSHNSDVLRKVIFRELSNCYSEIEDYKKAYEYLQLSQENHG